ncbi:MAG: hypothetical protein NVS1B14_06410 [Vulcanimicrobiaceae bacterium]
MSADHLPPSDIRSDLSAHQHAMSIGIQDVVRELTEILGATTVAVIGGVSETRAVQQWMTDREPQRPHTLRFALQIATMLASSSDYEMTRAWFHGINPRLEDQMPVLLLRNKPLGEIQGPLLAAARAFAAGA